MRNNGGSCTLILLSLGMHLTYHSYLFKVVLIFLLYDIYCLSQWRGIYRQPFFCILLSDICLHSSVLVILSFSLSLCHYVCISLSLSLSHTVSLSLTLSPSFSLSPSLTIYLSLFLSLSYYQPFSKGWFDTRWDERTSCCPLWETSR